MASYVELRARSAFSFGDGSVSPERLVRRAAELGYPALGLTDTADLGGLIRFALEAERCGVKPLAGAELVVDGWPLALLAGDAAGYRNLATLVTRARVGDLSLASPSPLARPSVPGPEPERGAPALTFQDIVDHAAGLWCLTGPPAGELGSELRARRRSEAVFALERWHALFGDRLAVEVQLHHVSGEESALAAALIELAERGRVRWFVANEPRYLDGPGRLVHDVLVANRADVCVNTAASWGLLLPNGEWRLKSPAEMATLWRGREAGLHAAAEIADECAAFDLRWLRPPLPHFAVPRGHDDDSWLRELAFRGAVERWGEVDERQRAQLEHELGVIRRLGFAGFFLVMWDAIRFAREQRILCQGRGSAANSAVAYCLGITAVDPVRHGLLFERFLSEVRTDGRTEAPDIDVDFEMHRREEVLDYMYARYARSHAAITAVTQTYHAPSAVQDVMRALGYPAELAFTLSKRLHGLAPSEGALKLTEEWATSHGFDAGAPRGRAVLAALRALDDVPRMRSTHPGGFVLSSSPLGGYLPIERTTMGRTIVQFDKDDLDAAGVPKFDFLGLGGLSAVHLAFDAIEQRTGEKLELYTLPVDDRRTFEMIADGDTVGTFQIESRAQIQSILHTKPERLYDIVVQVALIRPGPIQARFVHPYTERRRGREPVVYAHPKLEPILRRTYGVPIFQEQAMAISMALGGFSAAEADELRRAMGHRRKLPKLQAALERLHARCVANGVGHDVARQVVEDLHSFANYGFPESHAWSFALIAYATAYLKANYPADFYLGMLNAWPMGFYPPSTLVHDARRHGVVVLPPCMKCGDWECMLVPGTAEKTGAQAQGTAEKTGAQTQGTAEKTGAQAQGTAEKTGAQAGAGAGSKAGAWRTASAGGLASVNEDGSGKGHGPAVLEARGESHEPACAPAPEPGFSRPGDEECTLVPGTAEKTGAQAQGTAEKTGAQAGAGAGSKAGAWRTASAGGLASVNEDGSGKGQGPAVLEARGEGHEPACAPAPEPGLAPPAPTHQPIPHLRIGWKHIRGLGEKTRQALQDARAAGPFTSIEDVIRRARLSRADALHIARSGAFEAFEPGRRRAAWEALRAVGDVLPLAPAHPLRFEPRELDGAERVFLDYLATGICVDGHPMEHVRERLDALGMLTCRELAQARHGETVIIAGLVVARQHPETANGTVFVLMEDEYGFTNVVVQRELYAANREVVKFSPFLIVEGRVEREDRVISVVGRRFRELRLERLVFRSRDFR